MVIYHYWKGFSIAYNCYSSLLFFLSNSRPHPHKMHPLYRKLLREWKRLSHYKHSTCHIKPQESNLQFWNIVLHDESRDLELYCVVFISHKPMNEWEPIILLNCLTPNPCIPVNKTICLNHLSPVLLNYGLCSFYEHLLSSIYSRCTNITDYHKKLAMAWNRIMVKEFKNFSPRLFESYSVTQTDVQMVNEYLQTQAQSQPNHTKRNSPKLHSKSPTPVDTDNHITNEDCSEQLYRGKRQRTGLSSFMSVSPLTEPNLNNLETSEDCDFLESRKRRR